MTPFSLLISFVNRELGCAVDSIRHPSLTFKDDFSFYSDSAFADDFWISTSIMYLTIPFVKHESIFAIGFTRQSWILWRYRLHTSAVTHITVAISGSTLTLFSLTISGQQWRSLGDDSMRQLWLCFLYWFHSSTVNKLAVSIPSVSRDSVSKLISRFTVTKFCLSISGSALA